MIFLILPCKDSKTMIFRTPTHHKNAALKFFRQKSKITLYDLREATASHLSKDGVSLRGSVVEKIVTNRLV